MKRAEAKTELIDKVLVMAGEHLAASEVAPVHVFLLHYYGRTDPDDLVGRSVIDVYGAALSHWQLAQVRSPGTPKIRAYTPEFDRHGWQSTHSVVEIVCENVPFLVDSVTMELSRHGCGIHRIIHPVFAIRRDSTGRLVEALPVEGPDQEDAGESFIQVEFDRQADPSRLEALSKDLERVLADVEAAVEDRAEMQARARETAERLRSVRLPCPSDDVAEAAALLDWMSDDHFTFLGHRLYDLLSEGGEDVLRAVPDSGLGILRQPSAVGAARSFAKLPPEIRRKAHEPELLNLTKANARSTVHRPAHLDYVGVKEFDEAGKVIRERRFLGLYTATVYRASPFDIPVLRRKVEAVVDRAGFAPESHSGKALEETLEAYPRDELFQVSVEDLFDTAMGIMRLQERQRLRLFVRRETFGRYLSCLVYVPRDRYNTNSRERMQRVLLEAFNGVEIEYSTSVSESVLARLHFVVRTRPGEVPDHDVAEIENRLADAVRSWVDDLHEALIEQCGEGQGVDLFRRYAEGFPASYRDDFSARAAVADIRRIETLAPDNDLGMSLYHPLEAGPDFLRFKLFRCGDAIPVSDVLPVLENMGVRVVDERPYHLKPLGRPPLWIYDFGLRSEADGALETDQVKEIFQDAFARVWRGEAENDGFNRLVLRSRLTWREVTILRAYSKFLRQAGTTFSQTYMEETLARHPDIARALVDLFHARFRPAARTDLDERSRQLVAEIEAALDGVTSLDEDRILRNFLQLTMGTLRTNYFRTGADGEPRPYLSLKLDPALCPDLPLPRPLFEIFVYSPAVEGVHLRGGKVARGGIRWSDRREDFRTEILGLMKAQMVKNAVIVPVGAKGGFVVKRPPKGTDRAALMAEVVSCYQTFIRGLLDITDNLVGEGAVAPPDVVRYDTDDPYLVVAADKGTATFSDIANAISLEYGYWLGDAFASGGSSGYDHKKMGITAKGAWESVKRHFWTLHTDIQSVDFTVVGIGDMSGDVFGNGMLLSPHIKLIAAFDHRHIFLDPKPDPASSFAERQRLFGLPASSWADYQAELISAGGGVYPRTAKSIPLSAEAQEALGVLASHLTPNELVSAILQAPVDLLWNGGIGTYVKASFESHFEVGDKANDAVRVDASDLRCRVVGEGGNLGFTQRGRVEFAQRGGLINTDAIDNSAGVDCSDHEVNIKVLLDAVVADGDLTRKQRDQLIVEMEDEVAGLVLEDNYAQTQALSNALAQAPGMVDVHARYLRDLEQHGNLHRDVEFLPDQEELTKRENEGRGLVAPEFATLMAYTKITLQRDLLESDLPEDPYFAAELQRYFPTALRERFRPQIEAHRLRRELIATGSVNRLVNRAGTTFAFRLSEETGATPADIARAFTVASEIFDTIRLWAEIEALDNLVVADVATSMRLEVRKLVERASRWLLRSRRSPLNIAATITEFAADTAVVGDRLGELLVGQDRKAFDAATDQLVAAGVPIALAQRVAGSGWVFSALDITEVAHATGEPVPAVAAIYFALGEALQLDWLRDSATALPRDDRWQALARAALRDDVYADHVALTAQVVRSGHTKLGADACIDDWISRNRHAVERFEQVVAEIQSRGVTDLVTLSVAVREMRSLIQVSGNGR
ncbi:MAG: glutamate dehydrogenase [Acidimicrobiia bacterium]|nr:glutamate dehydrogenase [Acidimicrobiia bacterium]